MDAVAQLVEECHNLVMFQQTRFLGRGLREITD